MVSLLHNTVRDYAWGSLTAIPELLGEQPDGTPQAELWMGAHEGAPSILASGNSLYDAVQADPVGVLGMDVAQRFGGRFPYLAKILAAAQPLSIQAHPSPAQALEGCAREDAARVPRNAPERNYRDGWPKPEILIALGTFEALVGFRPLERTLAFLDALRDGKLAEVFGDVLSTATDAVRADVAALGEACRIYTGSEFALEAATLDRLAQDFPDDPGVLAAVLLNRIRLERFDAMYLPAGNVHEYLHGTGFEVMAISDNVLRATPAEVPCLSSYRTGCEYFSVRRADLDGAEIALDVAGPRIVACVDGAVTVRAGDEPVELTAGRSAFVSATEPPCSLTGRGTAFVVSVA